MHVNVKSNEYADALGDRFIDQIPKAVLAAIAVSALTTGGERLTDAKALIAGEWLTLWENGIIPQRPPASIRAEISYVPCP